MARPRTRNRVLGTALFAALLAVTWVGGVVGAGDRSDLPADQVFGAVVGIRAFIPSDARTAEALGVVREGSGVVIDDGGLVVTIGYLILEAERVEITTGDEEAIPAAVVAYDAESGFGLVRAEVPPAVRPMELGDSESLAGEDPVVVASFAGGPRVTAAKVASRRLFAGYWEYLLDDAIFTMPPHPDYGGAALITKDARLVGIGALLVGDAREENVRSPGNMFVPVQALKPILGDLLADGRRSGAVPPWLGLFAQEVSGRVFVTRTASAGPAEAAGLEPGDVIVGVDGKRIAGLADFFRRIRALGAAGTDIPLDVVRHGSEDLAIQRISVRSADRADWLRLRRND